MFEEVALHPLARTAAESVVGQGMLLGAMSGTYKQTGPILVIIETLAGGRFAFRVGVSALCKAALLYADGQNWLGDSQMLADCLRHTHGCKYWNIEAFVSQERRG